MRTLVRIATTAGDVFRSGHLHGRFAATRELYSFSLSAWTVTHVETGRSIQMAAHLDEDTAIRIAKRFDWWLPPLSIGSVNEEARCIAEAIVAEELERAA